MNVENNDELPENHNLKCHICGENRFDEREGFYYCQECGTKQEQVRAVEVDREHEFDQEKLKARKQKIHVVKNEKPQLTSWECYNYILRGFVEDLLSFGAKEELKLMALQIWAAYLRRLEVAFFNRKQADLPRLGVKYLQNDAHTIYNHSKEIRKKRKRRRSMDTSCTSGNDSTSRRSWNKSKRNLDESNYSLTSVTSPGSGLTSSTSANSNRAIKIGFSSRARAILKKKMPIKHLEKHGADAEGLLKCHKQPNAREINRTDYNLMSINTKQIFSVLAIALNLIGDDIQLCDLVRFINERHIGISNVLQYFPENIANHGKEMLTKINFYKCPEKYSEKGLRDHIGILCKNIGIYKLKNPDLIKLVRRYVTELCLPTEIACFIERLINLLPPNFHTRANGMYPAFEARAMAYIIFALKLLFGLDDLKEHRISQAAKNLNSKIEQLNFVCNEKKPLLFVWSEWMEYIEMRKVIVSQFNVSFCEQFKQCQSTNQVLEQMSEEIRRTTERNDLLIDKTENINFSQKLINFKSVFDRFQDNCKYFDQNKKPPILIEFKPSFTPALSYLKTILLFCNDETNTNSATNVQIPDFMHTDHSKRDINSFLQVKPVIEYFKSHQLYLRVHGLAVKENKEQIGIFRVPTACDHKLTLFKACVDVSKEEWHEIVMDRADENVENLQFNADFNNYAESYKNKNKRNKQFFNPFMKYDLNLIHDDEKSGEGAENGTKTHNVTNNHHSLNIRNKDDLQSMHSFELFSENNMDPIDAEDLISEPRRNLENNNLFESISDEESVINVEDDNDNLDMEIAESTETIILEGNHSPTSADKFIKTEQQSPKFPKTAKSNDLLKMYISNMDCWMLLGNIVKTTGSQRSQLQDKFPSSFNWLLETCAQTISVEWPAVFEQLICLETMFCLGIEDPNKIKNCVYITSLNPYKEMQAIINNYREIW